MPLPRPHRDEREFLEFFKKHSKTLESAFSIEEVDCIYKLAGEESPFDFSSDYISMVLPYDDKKTRELLYKASKNISENVKRNFGDNVVSFFDYYR